MRRPLHELLEHFRMHHTDRGDSVVAAILYVGEQLQFELRQILAALPGDHITAEERAAIREMTAQMKASADAMKAAIAAQSNPPAADAAGAGVEEEVIQW